MELIAIKKNICTGCGACMNACPTSCIHMKKDELGFLNPEIDQNECIECNACNEACPAICEKKITKEYSVYAGINNDDDVRKNSSSGGIFTQLASSIIKDEGSVCGAIFDDEFKVKHIVIDKIEDIKALLGAKYVQSNMFNIYSTMESILDKGKPFLYSGTPCQVDAIAKTFASYDNLITCSVVCHGVGAPLVYDKYLKYVTGLLGEDISSINFRDKYESWRRYSVTIKGEDGNKYIKNVKEDVYMKGFVESLYLRESCYNCPSKPINGDIVIGDYWGVEDYHKEIDDDKGVSLLITYSKKGDELIKKCQNVKLIDSKYEYGIAKNPAIIKSTSINPNRNNFIRDFRSSSFENVVKKYLSPETRKEYIMKKLKKLIIKIRVKL